jgi:short-subunit dehydrogenase
MRNVLHLNQERSMPLPETLYGESASILITGASSGIGAALAEHLGRYGGKIALVARREQELREVAERVRAAGGRALPLAGDVTDAASVARTHEEILSAQGPVDVAFLNAGMGDVTSVTHFKADRVKRLFEVNVFGVVHWLEVLFPSMVGRGRGIIAGTSSLAAARGVPGTGAYAASKAALSSLLESLRVEAQQHGVQIVTVEPGFVRSPMTDRNTFPMPFLMEAAEAARVVAEGVAEGQRVIRFPWQMAALIQMYSHLPRSLFDRVGASMIPKRGA